MPEGFSWTVSGATIIVALGWLLSIGLFLWRRSAGEALQAESLRAAHAKLDDISATWKAEKTFFDDALRRLDKDRQAWRDDIEKEIDVKFGAQQALIQLLGKEIGEVRENLAKNYMEKPEIAAIEKRVTEGQGRIIDRLEKIDERVSKMHDAVLAAIGKAR